MRPKSKAKLSEFKLFRELRDLERINEPSSEGGWEGQLRNSREKTQIGNAEKSSGQMPIGV